MYGLGFRVWGSGFRPKMCSGSEAGSYLRLTNFVYHSTLGLRVIKKKKLADLKNKNWKDLGGNCDPKEIHRLL